MAQNERRASRRSDGRLRLFAAAGLIALVVLGFLVWWLVFRDTSPASVDSAEAAEARQEAIAEAAQTQDSEPVAAVESDPTPAEPTAEVAQPDAPASVSSAVDGIWTVDTTIGTFDDSCLTDVCSSSFAGFRIKEELARIGAQTVVGRTPGVSGSIEILGPQIISASFFVDMTGLITEDDRRNQAIRASAGGLETFSFPQATFVLTQPIDLGEVPVEGASVQVEAVGDLTVHGVTKDVTIPLTAEHQAGVIVVFGNLEGMLLDDYDIPAPTSLAVLSVEDNATMEFQLFFSR